MTTGRCYQTATLLANGQVLVAGGSNTAKRNPNGYFVFVSIASAELYNPATGTWQATGSLNTSREYAVAELLQNGKVLVAGGYNVTLTATTTLASAELFDPSQGQWSFTGSMSGPATSPGSLLANGDALVSSRAFYNPATGTWTNTGTFPTGVALGTTATLLATGKVLLTGFTQTCRGCRGAPTTAVYLYDFSTNTYRFDSMNAARFNDSAVLLPSGQVLVSGGEDNRSSFHTLTSAELYAP
jgi:hypothetical protein